jgi:hypothetical protein
LENGRPYLREKAVLAAPFMWQCGKVFGQSDLPIRFATILGSYVPSLIVGSSYALESFNSVWIVYTEKENVSRKGNGMEALVYILGAVAEAALNFLFDVVLKRKRKKKENGSK